MFNPYEVRKDFPILERKIDGNELIYFDNAATSQKPIQVIEAIKEFYSKHNANIHRAVHTLSQEATELSEKAHEEVASLINASGLEEIVFTKSTTEAINLIAYSWGLRNLGKKDEIIVTLMDHHSNLVPWYIISKLKKPKLKFIGVNREGVLKLNEFENSINRKTKLVCVPHVSNVTGVINDVKSLTKLAHEYDAIIVVDGAQSVPRMPLDVKTLDVDFLAFSGHKMLGPMGIGVLYGKKDLLKKTEPFLGGGDAIEEVRLKNKKLTVTWNKLPWKFEAGTQNIAGQVGLMEAIKYLKRIEMDSVFQHEKKLTEYALRKIEEIENIALYGPKNIDLRSGIIAFNVKGFDSHEVALFLDQFGIMVRSGFHCAQPLHQCFNLPSTVRASFYLYNIFEEIDRFIGSSK
ncbi:MAG: SufS family cysteine desulfurase [Candidatus Bathyarchaeia archaeon]